MGIIDSIKDAMRGDDDPKKADEAAAADPVDPVDVARAQQEGQPEVVDPVDIARAQQDEGSATAEIPTTTPPVGSGVVVGEGTPPAAPAPAPADTTTPAGSQAHEHRADDGNVHAHDHGHAQEHGQGHGHGHPDDEHGQTQPRHTDPDRAEPPHAHDEHHEPGQHQAPAGKHAQRDDGLRTYTVVSGDTLSEIGAKFGVPYEEIAKLNHVDNPDLIFPGQVFRIPNS